jgi:hypothetical protein
MKSYILIATLTLGMFSICDAKTQPTSTDPLVAQTYLEQCLIALELSRDDRSQMIPDKVENCESKALGVIALKKPAGVRSSRVETDRFMFSVVVIDSKGKILSSETDPATYNKLVIQRKAMQVAIDRAARAYVLNCYKALNASYVDKSNITAFSSQLNTCESSFLEAYAMHLPEMFRSSKVGPKDPKKPFDVDNLYIEVTSLSGKVYMWNGNNVVSKP